MNEDMSIRTILWDVGLQLQRLLRLNNHSRGGTLSGGRPGIEAKP